MRYLWRGYSALVGTARQSNLYRAQTSETFDKISRHFYGFQAIILGTWEGLAYLGKAPTITQTIKKHPRVYPLVLLWLIGLGKHFRA